MRPTAQVFDIQRFSLHDGPGIRSLVFLKGCGLHCAWCQNPESQSSLPVLAFHRDRCAQSFECAAVCSDGAVVREGHRINYEECTLCGKCLEACATGALRLIGESCTPEELVARLIADRAYFDSSGGGVTFTGGEPTLRPRFLTQVLQLCSDAGIHTNIETSGSFSWSSLESALSLCDLIYFDLKILDGDLHRRHVGEGLSEILDNAKRLATGGFPVEFRMPVVAGYTDTPANVAAVIELLHTLGRPQLHLLNYHNMGEAKITIIDGEQPTLGLATYPSESLSELSAKFESHGIEVVGHP